MAYLKVVTKDPIDGQTEFMGNGCALYEKNAVRIELSKEIKLFIPWSNIISVKSVEERSSERYRERIIEQMQRMLMQSVRIYSKETGYCLASQDQK